MAEEQTCDRCGMELSLGNEPTEVNDKHYCCKGCANESGCTC